MRNILKIYEIKWNSIFLHLLKTSSNGNCAQSSLFTSAWIHSRYCATEKECDAFLRSSRCLREELKSRYTLCGEIFSRVINIQHPLPLNQTRVSSSRIQLHFRLMLHRGSFKTDQIVFTCKEERETRKIQSCWIPINTLRSDHEHVFYRA